MKIITLGFLLVFIGILVILVGMLSMVYQTWKTGGDGVEKPETCVRGGGVIMIGPLPIIFGSERCRIKNRDVFSDCIDGYCGYSLFSSLEDVVGFFFGYLKKSK